MAKKPPTTPRKKASQERSRATVDSLLEATARVLVQDGYDRASTNKIANAAGVSIGSLYQYFPTKEALVAAVIERHTEEMMAVVRRSLVGAAAMPLAEATRELVTFMIEAHRISPKLHQVLVEQTPRVGALCAITKVDDEAKRLVRTYLESRRSEIRVDDLDLAAFVSVTIVEALTHAAVLQRPEFLEDPRFVDEVAAVVVRYLSAPAMLAPR